MSTSPLYFRQLLSGRDFAAGDPLASQMVNFVYAVGDHRTGQCVLIDPAYAVGELVDLVGADPEVLVDRGIDEDLGLGLGFAFVAFSTRSISKKKSMFAPSASTNNKLY